MPKMIPSVVVFLFGKSATSARRPHRLPRPLLQTVAVASTLALLTSVAFTQTGRLSLSKRKGRFYLVGCASNHGSMHVQWNPSSRNQIDGIGTIYQGQVAPPLAAALSEDVNAARMLYGVAAPMLLVVEEGSPNAAATQIVLSPALPDGSVFFGLNLMTSEFQSTAGHGIPTIIGHEYAHVMQMKRRLPVRVVKWRELHADFMAGWFTANRARYRRQNLDASAVSIFGKGSYDFNNPDFHGTPEERLAAYVNGARANMSGQAPSAGRAYDLAVQYIQAASGGTAIDNTVNAPQSGSGTTGGDDPAGSEDGGTTPDTAGNPDSKGAGGDDTAPYFMRPRPRRRN